MGWFVVAISVNGNLFESILKPTVSANGKTFRFKRFNELL